MAGQAKQGSDVRVFERELRDRTGRVVRVRVELNLSERLDHVIAELANKAQGSRGGKVATAGHGIVRVTLLGEQAAPNALCVACSEPLAMHSREQMLTCATARS